MREIWAFYVISAKIESGLGVRCPHFSAHFRGTNWSPRPKQRRCTGTSDTDSTGNAKKPGLEPLQGANGVPFVGSNHTQEYNLKTFGLKALPSIPQTH
eukprot:scaffold7565_cov80-Phaeocystis_antarctica.AAC.6